MARRPAVVRPLFLLGLLAFSWPAAGSADVHPAFPDRPPAPELSAPAAGAELRQSALDALPAGVRAPLLLDLALRRHHEAEEIARDETQARAGALARWRAAGSSAQPPPPQATPRADERRAQAVSLAERALEEGGASFPRAPEALLVAGLDSGQVGRPREGLRHLGALVRRYPGHSLAQDAWLALGERHLHERELTRARAAFEVAARGSRLDVRAFALARLADTALQAGDAVGAVSALSRALDAGAYRAARLLEILGGEAGQVEKVPEALEQLADVTERAGDPGRAAVLRERLVKVVPRDSSAARARSALAAWRKATARAGPPARLPLGLPLRASSPAAGRLLGPAVLELRVRAAQGDASALDALALLALGEGRPGEARVLLQRACASTGGVAGAPEALENDMGIALHALGDSASARAAFRRAVGRDPAFDPALENLGALALADGDAAEAERSLGRITARPRARWEARLLRASALAALRRDGEALAEAQRVLEVRPGQAQALALAATLRERLGPTATAIPIPTAATAAPSATPIPSATPTATTMTATTMTATTMTASEPGRQLVPEPLPEPLP